MVARRLESFSLTGFYNQKGNHASGGSARMWERCCLQKAGWNPLTLSSAGCREWQPHHTLADVSRLVWRRWLTGSILPPTDKFKTCPCSSVPADSGHNRYSSFKFSQTFRCGEACNMLLSPPPPRHHPFLLVCLQQCSRRSRSINLMSRSWVYRHGRDSGARLWMFIRADAN